ncbi:hypothetical protein SAMN04488020_105160 [Palleronia marisminoris]|uniref:SMODS and SLOG-associating 2TM effector domain-containing protein n=2 Tax=Palleronia marisminoris TaxID=315423 RepID=A0A1Y5SSR5_9RHOB|nr:hypothetical protein SAMN04488020_105160 [Palleronia marisminoris]SLN47463.1 hypothetical protein PAM7066_02104 [Palleronia marisminoris]
MKAEKRSRFRESYFHITLALYSLAIISIPLLSKSGNADYVNAILTFSSVCTLSLGLLVFGFRFGETAAQHRSCYLDLQRLRESNPEDATSFNTKYIDTLGYYPNHSSQDYIAVVLSNPFKYQQELKDSEGRNIKLSAYTRLKYVSYWAISKLFFAAFAALPALVVLASIIGQNPIELAWNLVP